MATKLGIDIEQRDDTGLGSVVGARGAVLVGVCVAAGVFATVGDCGRGLSGVGSLLGWRLFMASAAGAVTASVAAFGSALCRYWMTKGGVTLGGGVVSGDIASSAIIIQTCSTTTPLAVLMTAVDGTCQRCSAIVLMGIIAGLTDTLITFCLLFVVCGLLLVVKARG